ncbi:MAG TPA: hypothetical protein PLI95_02705 [Polyangiaceae bacterium]|nr:hypothetical protein [Polyangiaceae bacterium]
MLLRASCVLVATLLFAGCGGDSFVQSEGVAGAAGDASVSPDAAGDASGGGAGKAGSAGSGGSAGQGGASGGAPDAGPDVVTCPTGQELCGTVCINLQANPSHCGACNHACNAGESCEKGACVQVCSTDTTNCGGSCVSLNTDLDNCGACGEVCSTPNADPICAGGHCQVKACNTGFADCDQAAANGCEVELAKDPANCGECGKACADAPNAGKACVGGKCTLECTAPWEDCNADHSDGCEANLQEDVATCGACKNVCSFAHAETSCEGGLCKLGDCATGWADCDGSDDNGCEADLQNSVMTCGTCANKCSFPNAQPGCSNGSCYLKECNSFYGDCNGKPSDGCELPVASDVWNCGGCGRACSGTGVTSMTCTSGLCVSACDSGLGNCTKPSGPAMDNGCETSVTTQKQCGGCDNDCSKQGISAFTCLTSGSAPRCGCTNGAQCGQSSTSPSVSCTAAGVCRCSLNATSACNPGEHCVAHVNTMVCACNAAGGCATGQLCCAPPVGCVNPLSDAANCGACGRACAPGMSCVLGNCRCSTDASCNAGTPGVCKEFSMSIRKCVCGGVTCAEGERCLSNGFCG